VALSNTWPFKVQRSVHRRRNRRHCRPHGVVPIHQLYEQHLATRDRLPRGRIRGGVTQAEAGKRSPE
jgi:hypothetical protein